MTEIPRYPKAASKQVVPIKSANPRSKSIVIQHKKPRTKKRDRRNVRFY